MADTEDIPCPKGEWTELVTGPRQDCLCTPTLDGYFRYEDTQPTAEYGHYAYRLEQFMAVPEGGQKCWFKSPIADCVVVVTDRPEEEA